MKFRTIALMLALAISVPVGTPAMAQETNITPANEPANVDMEIQIDQAKDRLDKAKVRLDIAKKQVEAARARMKAAEAEFKAATANHDAKHMENQAKKLSDASGLPEISEGQIQQTRTKTLATSFSNLMKGKDAKNQPAAVAAPVPAAPVEQPAVDLSKTRLKGVDFNAQPMDQSAPAPQATPDNPPAQEAPNPDKQAAVESAPAPQAGLMAASQPVNFNEQPPIVP